MEKQGIYVYIDTTLVRRTPAERKTTWQTRKTTHGIVYCKSFINTLKHPQLQATFPMCMIMPWSTPPAAIDLENSQTET